MYSQHYTWTDCSPPPPPGGTSSHSFHSGHTTRTFLRPSLEAALKSHTSCKRLDFTSIFETFGEPFIKSGSGHFTAAGLTGQNGGRILSALIATEPSLSLPFFPSHSVSVRTGVRREVFASLSLPFSSLSLGWSVLQKSGRTILPVDSGKH